MKLSLSWIFDHINADWHSQSIPDLVHRFNATTAEIEHFYEIKIDPNLFALAQIKQESSKQIIVYVPEWNKEYTLVPRSDLQINYFYLVYQDGKDIRWATLIDLGSEKEGLVPALAMSAEDLMGGWKKNIELVDYILVLDNKSITNRPDLWGHRGFAREIAAILGFEICPENQFLAHKEIHTFEHYAPASPELPLALKIASKNCTRLAALAIPEIKYLPSDLRMVVRLTRIDARPINFVVDATNYVMYDWGHPMHAFDAAKIDSELVVRDAYEHESLTLLDDEKIILRAKDCVIADRSHALSLAGIMGGKDSCVNPMTHSLIIEAAHFDPTAIRLSATHFKKRTEASARFEKSLDPFQNIQALLRFIRILADNNIDARVNNAIISLGPHAVLRTISLNYSFIKNKLGMPIDPQEIMRILDKLGFKVSTQQKPEDLLFVVNVPTWRVTKDISIPEDIIEEIARFFGYDSIMPQLPKRLMHPYELRPLMRERLIKELCASVFSAHEVYNYALYDEDFLHEIKWAPHDAIFLKNPLSESKKRLVTSLVPHILQNIKINAPNTDQDLHFFEINKVWSLDNERVIEQMQLAIVMSSKKHIDFYDAKELLVKLFEALGLLVEWRKPLASYAVWYSQYQTAQLFIDNKNIGFMGIGSAHKVEPIIERSSIIMELDMLALLHDQHTTIEFKPISKFQSVMVDISMLLSYNITVIQLEKRIHAVDSRIKDVYLTDSFTKSEWHDKRSLTMRCVLIDDQKTLSKQEIDYILHAIQNSIKQLGGEIR